jgi:hypothetical protein
VLLGLVAAAFSARVAKGWRLRSLFSYSDDTGRRPIRPHQDRPGRRLPRTERNQLRRRRSSAAAAASPARAAEPGSGIAPLLIATVTARRNICSPSGVRFS